MLQIRDWQDGDDLRLLEIFGDPHTAQHHHDRTMLGPSTREPFGVGLVGVDEEVPVAAGAIRAQALHPQRMWCYLETAPLQRQRGIASQLFEQLTAQLPEHTALKTRSVAGDEATAAWLIEHGFAVIQQASRTIIASGAYPEPEHEVEELATGSVQLSKVVAEYYNAVHEWDPSTMSITQAQQYLLAPQTGAQQALITRDEHGIVAFGIAYPGPIPNVVDMLIGHVPNHPDAVQHVQSVLSTATQHRSLAVETDHSTNILNQLVEHAQKVDRAMLEHASTIWATDVPNA